MATANELDLRIWYLAVGKLDRDFAVLGVSWEIVTDHKRLRDVVAGLPSKELSSHFSIESFEFTDENWYALVATDESGRAVGLVAGRLDRMGKKTLAAYWGGSQEPGLQGRMYKGGALGSLHAPGAHLMTGNVVYCGEMYVDPDYRRSGIGSVLSRLNHIVGYLHLQKPAYMYALMGAEQVRDRWNFIGGFSTCEPVGVDWVEDPEGARRVEYLCYNTEAQILRLIEATAADDIGFELVEKI